jgi:hypothetical protein
MHIYYVFYLCSLLCYVHAQPLSSHHVLCQIFLMVGHIFASAIAAMDRHPAEQQRAVLEYHLAPFESFIRELWWDVARNPSSEDLTAAHLTGGALVEAQQQMARSDGEAQKVLRELLMGMVGDSYELLSHLFHLGERGLTDRLSAEYVARLVISQEPATCGVHLSNIMRREMIIIYYSTAFIV